MKSKGETRNVYLSPVSMAKEADLPEIYALEHTVFPAGVAESLATEVDRLQTFNEGFLVYREKGKVLGYVTSEKWAKPKTFKCDRLASKAHDARGKILHISTVAVNPRHQLQGVGTRLLQTLLAVARKHKCVKAVLITRAQADLKKPFKGKFAFYEKFGFKRARVVKGFFRPKKRPAVDGIVLELDLRPSSMIKDKIPKALDANKLLQRFSDFLNGITAQDRVALVHHLDADGLTSACVLNRAIEKIRGRPAELEIPSGYSDGQMRHEVIPLLIKHKINKVFISDIGIDANPIIINESPKHIQFVVLDHHKIYRDLNSDRVLFIKAQYLSSLDGSKYPAAKLVYDCVNPVVNVRELDWITAIGVLADMGLDTWNSFIQEVCLRNKVTLEQLLDLKELISAVESLESKRFPELFREFYAAKSWHDVTRSKFMKLKKLFHREISRFYDTVYKKAEFIPELDLIFYEIKSKYEIKSALVNKLSTELFPKQTFILIQDKGDRMLRFSGRRQDFKVKVNDLLEEAVQGLEGGSAGGHIPAAAGRIAKTELEAFKANILAILVRQYFKSFRIRTACLQDMDAVLKIEQKSLKNKGLLGFKPVYEARLHTHPKGFFIAEINGRVVGFCCTERWGENQYYQTNHDPSCIHDSKGKLLFISSFAVMPEFHGKGLGSALLQHTIEFAREAGCTKVALCVDEKREVAINLFKRLGFKLARRLSQTFCVVEGKRCKAIDGMFMELSLKK